MPRTDAKRAHDPEMIPARKKRKIEAKARKREAQSNASFVPSDELRWREVELPERLEDAEGFLGLEEIEDVEVVRDEGGKHVMFRARSEDQVNGNENKKAVASDEDEWAGFVDDETAESGGVKGPTTEKQAEVKSSKTSNPPTAVETKLKPPENGAALQTDVDFEALDGIEEERSIDVSAWKVLQLSRNMLGAIAALGFRNPTPIQSSAIPSIRAGHDVIGKAVTGSGKTLAFGIPICEAWLEKRTQHVNTDKRHVTPIALILAPTRELAHQLSEHLNNLGKGLPEQPRIATVTGGLSIIKQQRQLEDASIVIGTPGRLWEVMNESQGVIDRLKKIQFLVVDEADRLLSEGHFKEVEDILDALDRQVVEEDDDHVKSTEQRDHRQTLVFSATFHKGLQQKLSGKSKIKGGELLSNQQSMEYLLKKLAFREAKPIFIDSNPTSQMAAELQETIIECGAMEKDVYLYALALQNPQAKILVFANSISSVRRLTPLATNLDLPAVALHSTMPQKARLRSLEKFADQRTILIATDVAARGLDINGIDLIVHYHVPRTADMYVHRSGRTARADKAGKSVLLCSPDEVVGVTRLISKVHNDKAPAVVTIDRGIITKLEPRIALAKKITDATLAKEKSGSQDEWLRSAAEDLGVDYDSEEFAAEGAKKGRGRGAAKSKKQKESGVVSKAAIAGMRAKLRELLSKRINLGISERYLAGGKVDVDALLEGRDNVNFLGGHVAR